MGTPGLYPEVIRAEEPLLGELAATIGEWLAASCEAT